MRRSAIRHHVRPAADSYVGESKLKANHDSEDALRRVNSPSIYPTCAWFDVEDVVGTIGTATLRPCAQIRDDAGYDAYFIPDNTLTKDYNQKFCLPVVKQGVRRWMLHA